MNDTWQTAPDELAISAHHVDIWLTSTDPGEQQVQAYRQSLTQAELTRAQKFKPVSSYREYIVTRGLLRQSLSRVPGLDMAGVDFDYGENGKPCLGTGVPGETVAFNVSHSHGLALVALSLGGRLGVDLEKIRARVEWRSLAQQYFSGAEARALDRYPRDNRMKAFFTCWTRKEAFVKALGAGIVYGLNEFNVSIDPEETYAALTIPGKQEDAARWLIKNIPVPASHVAALALDRPVCKFRLWRADPSFPLPCHSRASGNP